MKVEVTVKFEGVAEIEVPDHLSSKDAMKLATKIVGARMLITDENPDAPEEPAFDEYVDECSRNGKKTAEDDWDSSKIVGCGGSWVFEPVDRNQNRGE